MMAAAAVANWRIRCSRGSMREVYQAPRIVAPAWRAWLVVVWVLAGAMACSGRRQDEAAAPDTGPTTSQGRTFTLDAGGPYAATAGSPVVLSATRSVDPDGETLAFAWDFGDGTTASEMSSAHLYRSAGTYKVALVAATSKGSVGSATTDVVVMNPSEGNHAPAIVLNGPYLGVANQDLLMVAAGSSDPDGDTLSFAWAFGDGASESDSIVWHSFTRPGIYPVRVLVTDGRGGGTRRTTLAVIGVAPIAGNSTSLPGLRAVAPASAFAGQPVAFDVVSSLSAPGGDPLTFVWLFDDLETAAGRAPAHTFTSPGRHFVQLIATDGRGRFATTSLSVNIVRTAGNQAPVAVVGGPYSGHVGVPIRFDARASKDPDGDELTFVWDFGDGMKASGPTIEHVYSQAGTFLANVLVSDDNGASVAASATVAVTPPPRPANQPPVARAGGPYAGAAGQPITFVGAASVDPDGSPLTLIWAFGDGATGAGRNVAHSYARPGTYRGLLLVLDGKGASGATAVPVTVR
jgi:PKD repeat protein